MPGPLSELPESDTTPEPLTIGDESCTVEADADTVPATATVPALMSNLEPVNCMVEPADTTRPPSVCEAEMTAFDVAMSLALEPLNDKVPAPIEMVELVSDVTPDKVAVLAPTRKVDEAATVIAAPIDVAPKLLNDAPSTTDTTPDATLTVDGVSNCTVLPLPVTSTVRVSDWNVPYTISYHAPPETTNAVLLPEPVSDMIPPVTENLVLEPSSVNSAVPLTASLEPDCCMTADTPPTSDSCALPFNSTVPPVPVTPPMPKFEPVSVTPLLALPVMFKVPALTPSVYEAPAVKSVLVNSAYGVEPPRPGERANEPPFGERPLATLTNRSVAVSSTKIELPASSCNLSLLRNTTELEPKTSRPAPDSVIVLTDVPSVRSVAEFEIRSGCGPWMLTVPPVSSTLLVPMISI